MTNRSYPALKRVARIIQAVTVVGVAIVLMALVFAKPRGSELLIVGLGTTAGALLSWAAAEVLLMLAFLGEDMARAAGHAERIEALLAAPRQAAQHRDEAA